MSKRLWKKACAFLLTVCMLVTMLPVSALAKYNGYNPEEDMLGADYMEIIRDNGQDTGLVRMGFSEFLYDSETEEYISVIELIIRPNPDYPDHRNYSLKLPDYNEGNEAPWWSTGSGKNEYKSIYIEEGVKGIGTNAFQNMTTLEYVQIPSTVETIGANAFSGVSGAKFDDGNGGTTLDLSNVTSIGEGAFQNCSSMGGSGENTVTVKFGRALTDIGANAFRNTGLSQVGFSGATGSFKIGESAFSGNRISSLDLFGSGVTSLGTSSFEDNPLTSLTLPDTLTEIGEKAFYRSSPTTTGIVNLEIPASVKKIGASAFANNMQLSQVTIKSEALELGTAAFGNMESNAYHTTLTGDIEYVEGDLSGATSEDIKKVSNVSFSVGAEFKIPAALEAYFAAQKNIGYYGGDRGPLVYNESWSYPATCTAEGLEAYFYTLGDYTNVLHRDTLETIDHNWKPADGYENGYYDPSCTVGGYTQLFCDKNKREANSHWPDLVTAITEPHADEKEPDGTKGNPGNHDYQVIDIDNNGVIESGKQTVITYECQNENHDDNMELPLYRKERTVTINGASISNAKTTQTILGNSSEKLTLPTVSGGKLAWNTDAIERDENYTAFRGETLPAGEYMLPVIFTPTTASAKGLGSAASYQEDSQTVYLTIKVVVSKVELDFTNTSFTNYNRYIGLNTPAFALSQTPVGVTADISNAKYYKNSEEVDKPNEESGSDDAGDYTIKIPFCYDPAVYSLPGNPVNNNGLTITGTEEGTGTISGTYRVLIATMENIQYTTPRRTYTLQSQSSGDSPVAVAQPIVHLEGVLEGSSVEVKIKKSEDSDWNSAQTETYPSTTDTSMDIAKVTDAGTYNVQIVISKTNYEPRTIDINNVVVQKREVALPNAISNLQYNGESQRGVEDTAIITGDPLLGITDHANSLYYTILENSDYAVDAGQHTVRVQIDPNNCIWADGKTTEKNSTTFSIAKKPIRKISIADTEHAYDGSLKNAVTYTGAEEEYTYIDSAASTEDSSVTRTFSYEGKTAFQITAISATDAATYYPVAKILDTTNFYWEGDDTQQETEYKLSESGWKITPMELFQDVPTITDENPIRQGDNVKYTGAGFDESKITFALSTEVARYFTQDSQKLYTYYQGTQQSNAEISKPQNAADNYFVAATLVPKEGVKASNFIVRYRYPNTEQTGTSGKVPFTIDKADLHLIAPEEQYLTVKYSGEDQTVPKPSVNTEDLLGEDASNSMPEGTIYTFRYSITDSSGTSEYTPNPPTRKEVGEYTVNVYISSTNYNGVGNEGNANILTYTWKIEAAENPITLKDGDTTVQAGETVTRKLIDDLFAVTGTPAYTQEGEQTASVTYALANVEPGGTGEGVIRVTETGEITPLKVGKAKVNVTVSALPSYAETTTSFYVEILKGDPTVTVKTQEFPYGTDITQPGNDTPAYNDPSNVTVSSDAAEDAVDPTEPAEGNVTFTLYDSRENAEGETGDITDFDDLNAGTYYLRVDYKGDENYNSAFGIGELKISAQAMSDFTVSDQTLTYSGSNQIESVKKHVAEAAAAANNSLNITNVNVTLLKAKEGGTTAPGGEDSAWNTSLASITDVSESGTYFYRVRVANYNDAVGSFTVTVNPKEITVVGVDAVDRQYNGSNEVTLKLADGVTQPTSNDVVQDDSVFFALKQDATGTVEDVNAADSSKEVAVVSSVIDLSGDDAGNYKVTAVKTTADRKIDVVISPKEITLKFDGVDEQNVISKPYTGKPISVNVVAPEGAFVGNDSLKDADVKYTYVPNSPTTDNEHTAVGEYTVTAKLMEGAGNTYPNYKLTFPEAARLRIEQASIEAVTAQDYTGTYNGKAHSVTQNWTYTSSADGVTITNPEVYFISKDSSDTKPAADNDDWAKIDFKTVSLSGEYWYKVVAENHQPYVGENAVKITIEKATLTLKRTVTTDKTYDGTTSATNQVVVLEITGEAEGDDQISAVPTAVYDYAQAVGNRNLTITYTLSGDQDVLANYKVQFADETGQATGNEQEITDTTVSESVAAKILPAKVTVNIHNQDFTYSAGTPNLDQSKGENKTDGGWHITNGEIYQLESGTDDDLQITLSLAQTNAVDAGSYAITGHAGNSNYTVTFTGVWSEDNDNKGKAGICTIRKRDITIQIGDASGSYGDEPDLSKVEFTDVTGKDTNKGLAGDDKISDIVSTDDLSTQITASSAAGNTAPITVTELTGTKAGNYNVSWSGSWADNTGGTYTQTVRKMTVTIKNQSSVYGKDHVVDQTEYQLDNVDSGNAVVQSDLNSKVLGFTLTAGITADSNAGKYPIAGRVTGDNAPNYSIDFVGENGGWSDGDEKDPSKATYTINKADLAVGFSKDPLYVNYGSEASNPPTFYNASLDPREEITDQEDLQNILNADQYSSDNSAVSVKRDTGEITLNQAQATAVISLTVAETANFNALTTPATYRIVVGSAGGYHPDLTANTLTYTGEPQQLVTLNETLPAELTIEYSLQEDASEWETDISKVTGTDAGPYTVYWRITDRGTNYGDSSGSVPVTISKARLEDEHGFQYPTATFKYEVGATYDQNKLQLPNDYAGIVQYMGSNATVADVDPETGVVTIHTQGNVTITAICPDDTNYIGRQYSYTLTVSEAVIQYTAPEAYSGTYDGQAHDSLKTLPTVTDPSSGTTIRYGVNTNGQSFPETNVPQIKDAGKYEIWYQITDTSGGYASVSGHVIAEITPKQITESMVSKISPEYVYSGNSIQPKVTVTDTIGNSSITLVENVDYTVEYGENTEIGANEGKVTVRGMGNYAEEFTQHFNIVPIADENLTAELSSYYGSLDDPEANTTVSVRHGSEQITQFNIAVSGPYDTDQDQGYTVDAGNHEITFTRQGVYSITVTVDDGIHNGEFELSYMLMPKTSEGGLTLSLNDGIPQAITFGERFVQSGTNISDIIQVTANSTEDPGDQDSLTPTAPAEGGTEDQTPTAPAEGGTEDQTPTAPAEGGTEDQTPTAPAEGGTEDQTPTARQRAVRKIKHRQLRQRVGTDDQTPTE